MDPSSVTEPGSQPPEEIVDESASGNLSQPEEPMDTGEAFGMTEVGQKFIKNFRAMLKISFSF